jgi:hypothetical protein
MIGVRAYVLDRNKIIKRSMQIARAMKEHSNIGHMIGPPF